jgi:hypothetical protein
LRRFARLPRRILAISAATFIGALGAVAIAATPASAHTSSLTSTVECVEGKANTVKVTWTVTNNFANKASLSEVKLNGDSAVVGDIKDGVELANVGSTVVGSQEFSTTKNAPTLKVKVSWVDGARPERLGNEPVWPEGGCAPKKEPTRKATSNCDGTLTVVVTNADDKARRIAVNGEGEYVQRKTLKASETWEVVVPKENAGKVVVKWKTAKENDDSDTGWEGTEKFNWAKPDTCFTATSKSTCDGLSITVENTGAKAITAKVTAGDQSEETTIQPGENNTAEIDGVDGLVASLTVNGGTPQEFKWEKPADCGGAGGGLPTTGVNAGLLAGAALVLVSGGGGLFFMARRRRVRFAA